MKGTFFFVHGAGTRASGVSQMVADLRAGLTQAGMPDVAVQACSWGEAVGPVLGDVTATLPPVSATRGSADGPTPAARTAARWSLLLDDPLSELRIAAAAGAARSAEAAAEAALVSPATGGAASGRGSRRPGPLTPAGRRRLGREAAVMVRAFDPARLDLAASGVSPAELEAAAASVAASPELAAAAAAFGTTRDAGLADGAARAIVASVLAGHRLDEVGAAPAAARDPRVRDLLVARVGVALNPAVARGLIPDWLSHAVEDTIARQITRLISDRRAAIFAGNDLTAADILAYQRRPGPVLDFIAGQLGDAVAARTDASGPVVAVGHSLGGIALVDLLSRTPHPAIDLLVTVGSQSPLFFAFDALGTLRRTAGVAPFTPWLNVYCRQDLLSFLARPIFGGVGGAPAAAITDVELDIDQPFPAAHAAYWTDGRLYSAIRDHWPATGR